MSAQANPNYRVEHVATVPRGWRVRTRMMSTHMLRIAFPPGSRRKGTGKVIEILHPVNENPCAMSTKLARQSATRQRAARIRGARLSKNPDSTDQAAQLYEKFHGRSPKEIMELQESDAQRKTYTAIGNLVELRIDAADGLVSIGFNGSDDVKVASAPGGRQLYLLGGNQNIDSQLGRFGSDTTKDFVLLGTARQITYRARKSMNDFQSIDYYHDLGEETGEPPVAFYDRMKRRIFLAGGRYRVEAPGIIN
jgi:hypothetical protein